jgi:hypothetical protein
VVVEAAVVMRVVVVVVLADRSDEEGDGIGMPNTAPGHQARDVRVEEMEGMHT